MGAKADEEKERGVPLIQRARQAGHQVLVPASLWRQLESKISPCLGKPRRIWLSRGVSEGGTVVKVMRV